MAASAEPVQPLHLPVGPPSILELDAFNRLITNALESAGGPDRYMRAHVLGMQQLSRKLCAESLTGLLLRRDVWALTAK